MALSFPWYQQTLNNVEEELKHRLSQSLSMGGNNNNRHPKTNRRRKSMRKRMNLKVRKKTPTMKKTMKMTSFSGGSSNHKLGEGLEMAVQQKPNLFQLKGEHRMLRR
jgi:hypothetical protein